MLKKFSAALFSIMSVAFFSLFTSTAEARTEVNLGFFVVAPQPAPLIIEQGPPPMPMVVMQAPPPPTMVVMMPPEGYGNCYVVPGVWMGNVWVSPHQECQYPGPSSAAMWVSGYWGCLAVEPDGGCGRWKWYGQRWMRGGEVAYYRHGHYHHRDYY